MKFTTKNNIAKLGVIYRKIFGIGVFYAKFLN